jgi:hypothetical protein
VVPDLVVPELSPSQGRPLPEVLVIRPVHARPSTPSPGSTAPRRTRRTLSALLLSVALAATGTGLATAHAGPAAAADLPVSQGRPVTASSTENPTATPARAAVDGDATTRWSSGRTDTEWLQVDLGRSTAVTQVVLQWEAAYGRAFQLQVSEDATTWTTVATVTDGTGGTQRLAVSGTGRYVRMAGVDRATDYGYSLWEFQVSGTPAPTSATPACDTRDVTDGRTATASSVQSAGTPAAAAVDGNAGTRWSSAATDAQWWQVDLGTRTELCGLRLVWEAAAARAYDVQVSDDGTTWTTVAGTRTGTGGTEQLDVHATGRFLRLALLTRATAWGYSLWEVDAFAVPAGTTPAPTTPTTPTTPGCTTGAADGAVRVAGSKPNWCLLVDGRPWTVKGVTWGPSVAEFPARAADLTDLGVNTIRTWGTDAGSRALLDAAAAARMRVVAGFWLAPGGGPGSGGCPDYVTDPTYKANALKDITTWVTAYRDHPGVLMWDVGNESLLGMAQCWSGTQLEAQRNAYAAFVNEAAVRIHSLDPKHPVTNTDAWTGAWDYLKRNAPALDLYGLNTYGGVCGTEQAWVAGGYDKPYLITEGGPTGDWEAKADVNGIPDQGTDRDNAAGYTTAWRCVQEHPGVALGATLFNYGTETDFGGIWFNLLPGGERRLAWHAVAAAYGAPAAQGRNTPPVFTAMTVAGSTAVVAGSTFRVDTTVSDPDGDALTYDVRLNSKNVDGSGALAAATATRSGTSFTVTAPQALGVHKVYVFARDGRGNVGVETRSFRVVPPAVTGTNIAAGRPATASSYDPYNGDFRAGRATDGDLATRWSSAWSDDQWVQVDLGSVRTFSRVGLVWESAYARGYLVQASDDGVTWRTLATVTDGNGNDDSLAVRGSGRYVRVQGTARGTAYGCSLFELQVIAP